MAVVDAEEELARTTARSGGRAKSSTFAAMALLFAACGQRADAPARVNAEPAVRCENDWIRVANGIEYRTLNCVNGRLDLHLVRVDPKQATIDAVIQPGGTAAGVARNATFALNANFFDERFQPIGVVASGGKALRPVHPVSWQSIFLVTRKRRPRIILANDWKNASPDAVTAVQAGPRLVIDGKKNGVSRSKPDWRSGVCIDPQQRAVFFVTGSDAQFDVWKMIDIAHDTLGCRDAMLFDGGPSAQLYVHGVGTPPVNVEGDKAVPVFVVGR